MTQSITINPRFRATKELREKLNLIQDDLWKREGKSNLSHALRHCIEFTYKELIKTKSASIEDGKLKLSESVWANVEDL